MISLIMTVLNEKSALEKWFDSISGQTLKTEEIIIVDGGSNDGSWEYISEKIKSFPGLKVFQEKGNIAHGRNFAIRKSLGEVIVVTDAGCTYDRRWLEKISEPLTRKISVWSATAFGPWFEEKDGLMEYAIAAATTPSVAEFRRNWLPSSRSVAFYRDRWQTSGGYPEWVPFCEDVLLDLRLLRKEGWPEFVREPLVYWRPRTTLNAFFKQLFNYTRSEGHAQLNSARQLVRFSAYLTLILIIVLPILQTWQVASLLIIGAVLYMLKFWKRWLCFTLEKKSIFRYGGIIIMPLFIGFGDIAKIIGYLTGFCEKVLGLVDENNSQL